MNYKNVMETLVEETYDKVGSSLDCCNCYRCRDDIIAYALNQLPPKYVATPQGVIYSKTYSLGIQHNADIMAALMKGANIVKGNPRH